MAKLAALSGLAVAMVNFDDIRDLDNGGLVQNQIVRAENYTI